MFPKGKHFNLTLESVTNKKRFYSSAVQLISTSQPKLVTEFANMCHKLGLTLGKKKSNDWNKMRNDNKKVRTVEIILLRRHDV